MKSIIISLFGLFLLTVSNQSLAAAQCTNNGSCCEELNQHWQERSYKDFEIISSDHVQVSDSFSCPSEVSKLAEGFMALDQISQNGTDYYGLTKTASTGFVYMLAPIGSAFATTFHDYEYIVFSNQVSDMLSPSTRAGVLVHEGQHAARNSETKHVECLHGQNAGEIGCDETLNTNLSTGTGAYSWHFDYLHNVRKSQANDLFKSTARSMMKALLANEFNEVPAKGPDGSTPLRAYYDL